MFARTKPQTPKLSSARNADISAPLAQRSTNRIHSAELRPSTSASVDSTAPGASWTICMHTSRTIGPSPALTARIVGRSVAEDGILALLFIVCTTLSRQDGRQRRTHLTPIVNKEFQVVRGNLIRLDIHRIL